jgi:ATP-dependent DNA ligase
VQGKEGAAAGAATCDVRGCMRVTWNGAHAEQCCRTCKATRGVKHGPECEAKARASAANGSTAQDVAAPKKQKLLSGAPLTRRNSSGSMGAANTTGRDAGGREAVQDASIPKLIALAKNWEPCNKKHDPEGMIMSEKLDGVRCYWNGEALFTRQGHMIFAPDNFTKDFPTDTHLDGELWLDRGKFQEISGLARTIVSEPRNWKAVRFVIFDAPQVRPFSRPPQARLAVLWGFVAAVPIHICCVVHTRDCCGIHSSDQGRPACSP